VLALPFIKLLNDVYVVAGPSLTHLYDAYAYSIVRSGTALLIDAGSGFAAEEMFRNIGDIGVKLQTVKYLVITHGHYDHIGGARRVKEKTNCKVIMHKLDADILEEGKTVLSAADFYGESLEPCEVDLKLETKDREVLKLEDIVLEVFTYQDIRRVASPYIMKVFKGRRYCLVGVCMVHLVLSGEVMLNSGRGL